VLFRCRIKKETLDKANRLAIENGTSSGELVRIFLTQFAKGQKLAINPDGELLNRAARDKTMRELDDTETW